MVSRAAPATIFNDMLPMAADIVRRGPHVTAMEIKRFEHQIRQLTPVDPSGALEMRAHLAAARDQDDLVDSLYDRAINQSDDFYGAVVRYVLVLTKSSRAARMREVVEKYRDALRTAPGAYREVSVALACMGWVVLSKEIEAELDGHAVGEPGMQGRTVNIEVLPKIEAEVAERVAFAHRFLRSAGTYSFAVRNSGLTSDDFPPQLLVELKVAVPSDRAADLEWDLFGEMSKSPSPADEHVVLSIVSSEIEYADFCK